MKTTIILIVSIAMVFLFIYSAPSPNGEGALQVEANEKPISKNQIIELTTIGGQLEAAENLKKDVPDTEDEYAPFIKEGDSLTWRTDKCNILTSGHSCPRCRKMWYDYANDPKFIAEQKRKELRHKQLKSGNLEAVKEIPLYEGVLNSLFTIDQKDYPALNGFKARKSRHDNSNVTHYSFKSDNSNRPKMSYGINLITFDTAEELKDYLIKEASDGGRGDTLGIHNKHTNLTIGDHSFLNAQDNGSVNFQFVRNNVYCRMYGGASTITTKEEVRGNIERLAKQIDLKIQGD